MDKELLELIAKEKELRSKIQAAASKEELDKLQVEVDEIEKRKELIVYRQKIAMRLNDDPKFGDSVPKPIAAPKQPENRSEDVTASIEYRTAFKDYVLSGGKKAIPAELRDGTITHQVTGTSDIGAVIPSTIIKKIIDKMEVVGVILPLVTRTNLKGGVAYPKSAVKPVATWVAEGATSPKQKKGVTSLIFGYYKLRCAVAMTLESSEVSLDVFELTLEKNVAEAMTKALEQAIISGDGVGKPTGIIRENPAATVTVGSSLTYEKAVECEASLPLAYESGAVYVMAKKTFMGLMAEKDSNGQPIARVNYGFNGAPERSILGRPVICVEYLPNLDAQTAASTVVGFLFNMSDYALNTNYTMGLKKYTDEETDDEIMKAVLLADGKVVDAGSLVLITKSA